MHSLTVRSLCVSFLLHLFICAICESLYKQLVHPSTCYNFLTDDTDRQIRQNFFAKHTHRSKGRGSHRIGGQVDKGTLESRQAADLCIRWPLGLCASRLPLHLFICAICESLYKQLVHSSTCYNFLTDDTDRQIRQNLIANRTQRPKGRGTHRMGGQVDKGTSRQVISPEWIRSF